MILELDRGNTLLKWRLCTDTGEILPVFTAGPHEGEMGFVQVQDDPAMHSLTEAVEAAQAECGAPLRRVRMVNVAGAAEERRIVHWSRKHWKIEPEVIKVDSEAAGVRNGYDEPGTLGADRWLALLAAYELHPDSGACVADCGSALTVDFVTAAGEHLGGYIAPGLAILSAALETALVDVGERGNSEPLPILGSYLVGETEQKPVMRKYAREEFEDVSPGRNTHTALRAAAPLMMAGLVELAYRKCVGEHPELRDPPILLSGGDRQALAPHLGVSRVEERPMLVLDGLRLVAP